MSYLNTCKLEEIYTVYTIDHKCIMIDQKKLIHFIEMYRTTFPDLEKEKGIQKWTGIVVTSKKRS